jgi:integrase
MNDHAPRLLDQVRHVLRRTHYTLRTEDASVGWIRRYVLFQYQQHPRDLGAVDVAAFLTHLAVQQRVAAFTQNQALLFLYTEVLYQPLDRPINAVRAQQPAHLPTVLTRDEAHAVLNALTGMHQIMAKLLYGSGLRLMECVRLRVKDLIFAYQQITVRNGNGSKDRVTMLSDSLVAPLQEHLQRVKSRRTCPFAHLVMP